MPFSMGGGSDDIGDIAHKGSLAGAKAIMEKYRPAMKSFYYDPTLEKK